jgi:hypothetical protein
MALTRYELFINKNSPPTNSGRERRTYYLEVLSSKLQTTKIASKGTLENGHAPGVLKTALTLKISARSFQVREADDHTNILTDRIEGSTDCANNSTSISCEIHRKAMLLTWSN